MAAELSMTPITTSNDYPPRHGVKRTANDNLESEQRLSKRFDSLHIGKRINVISGLYDGC
jgi:hypothetical protein